MPIFMDRHDDVDASPEEVAAAHLEDIKVQDRHGCRAFTYWLDEHRKTIFCLIEAPDAESVHRMHQEAHGLVPNQVIEVDPTAVSGFLGRVSDPESSPREPIHESGFRALMFTDMANSTDITHKLGDDAAYVVLKRHQEIILDALSTHQGREVDRAGDGFLMSFASVTHAVGCAVTIQRELDRHNSGKVGDAPIRVRIGLGAGEPVADGNALFGSTVNMTARICAHALPDQILASAVVRELCVGKGFVFEHHGSVTLKGFPHPVSLDAVQWRA